MKHRILICALALVLGGGVALSTTGCASYGTKRSTGEYIDDATLTTKVKAALFRDPIVKAFAVHVDTYRGTVQLNGWVDTPEQKIRAAQVAQTVPGVVAVQNELSVKTPR